MTGPEEPSRLVFHNIQPRWIFISSQDFWSLIKRKKGLSNIKQLVENAIWAFSLLSHSANICNRSVGTRCSSRDACVLCLSTPQNRAKCRSFAQCLVPVRQEKWDIWNWSTFLFASLSWLGSRRRHGRSHIPSPTPSYCLVLSCVFPSGNRLDLLVTLIYHYIKIIFRIDLN